MQGSPAALTPNPMASSSYLEKIQALSPSTPGLTELVHALSQGSTPSPKVWYERSSSRQTVDTRSVPMDAGELLQRTRRDFQADPNKQVMCVIENINAEYIEALGSAWGIDPTFFAGHAWNPPPGDFWILRRGERFDPVSPWPRHVHLDGIIEYHGLKIDARTRPSSFPNKFHRHCIPGRQNGEDVCESNTRISYCRVNPGLYLFLVDAPFKIQQGYIGMHRRHRPTLRFPYARNYGGILLPRLLDQEQFTSEYSIIETVGCVFQHSWHRDLIFAGHTQTGVFPGPPLLYLMASSHWQRNRRHLSNAIRKISFEEIRNPSPEMHDQLHDLREDLESLRLGLKETRTYISDDIDEFFRSLRPYIPGMGVSPAEVTIPDRLQDTLKEAENLERFLMDTFTLLLSSIGLLEAKMSRDEAESSNKQALRATQLTLLASIYVPLSFVTGVFGMNLKELNGSSLSIWVFFVGVVIAAIVTAAIFWAIDRYSKRERYGRMSRTKL